MARLEELYNKLPIFFIPCIFECNNCKLKAMVDVPFGIHPDLKLMCPDCSSRNTDRYNV